MIQQRDLNRTSAAQRRRPGERGFTLLQLLITIAIIGVVSTFAVMSIANARENLRLQNSARLFASRVEKARLDAIRRRTNNEVRVVFNSPTTYSITMDFGGAGVVSTRTFSFEPGVSFLSNSPGTIAFDWRGRMTILSSTTPDCIATFSIANSRPLTIDVTRSGDVTVDGMGDTELAEVAYTNVNRTADVVPDTVVAGATAPPVTEACSTTGTSTGGGTVTGGGGGCASFEISPALQSIKKNGGTTGTINVTTTAAGVITASGPSNLSITPASRTLTAAGTASFSVRSTNTSRGTFNVNISNGCDTKSVQVKVTN